MSSIGKYERPIEDVLAERSVEEVIATDSEKQALVRDTGSVAIIATLDDYNEETRQVTLSGTLPGETEQGTYTFDVETIGLGGLFEDYARQRPYWTTDELVRYRLSHVAPAAEVVYVRLVCDANAVWSLDWLYTEEQYERLFERYTEAAFRMKAKAVRRHGRVLGATPEPLFMRPVYAKYHDSDGASAE